MSAAPDRPEPSEVVLGREGRVLIPAQFRRDLGLAPGVRLLMYVEDGRLVLESAEQLMTRIRRDVADAWQGDPDRSVAEELLAERRAEATADAAR
jgi:AbrB family looped-hinge helix DNA binding protein